MSLSARHMPREREARVPVGLLLVLAGAGLVLLGLWAPWYRLHLPPGFIASFGRAAAADPSGMLAVLAAPMTELDRAGAIQATGWQAFEHLDVVMAGLAVVGIGAVVATHMGYAERLPADTVTLVAAVVAGVVVFRVVSPPGPAALLDTMWGAWMTLAGAVLMFAGARVARRC